MKLDLEDIKNRIKNFKYSEEDRETDAAVLTPASVLIPLYEKNDITHILLTKRTDKVRHHKGQISFPGGKRDPEDESLEMTALRETHEEVGIRPEDVTILGKINNMVTITDFLVSPFVGSFPYPYEFLVNPDEIAELIEVPFTHLLDRANFREELREINGFKYPIYYFQYQQHTIWGVTGKILFDFISLFK